MPDLLPPNIALSWSLVSQLSSADRALSELAGVARNLPNPHLLINPFVRREAVLSSQIEGTQTSLSELFFFEAAERSEAPRSDVEEVVNYISALEYGLSRLAEQPITLGLLKEMHSRLMQGVRGQDKSPGQFRREQNWIGPKNRPFSWATYVPPAVTLMQDALEGLERYLHSASDLPPLVRLALVHYQFEAIHPFADGNGRIGRLLITLQLCAEGLLPQPLLYLSAFFEHHRDEYIGHLLSVSRNGTWAEWVMFFLEGVAEQARDAVMRAAQLLNLREEYRRRLQSARTSTLSLRVMDDLFSYPALSIPQMARRLDVTPRAVQQIVDKLIDARILEEVTGRQRNRVFVSPEIVSIIAAPASA